MYQRVLYQAFDVTIEAGASVEVVASQTVDGSYNYESTSGFGYDVATTLGSAFSFDSIELSMTGADGLSVLAENGAFDVADDLEEWVYFVVG